ncbi:carbohydrate-binding protein [Kineosporia succinea]|uniref:CBM6 domain-containing protein n=1 Tax=Kineosporia succinea TaxID=84632 RepID=A0ABT9P914_9ACTN|nr:hypothetical protein [Kineosporia succinea]MDP9829173.1 hypothetical protein [Kineosporia succinea]
MSGRSLTTSPAGSLWPGGRPVWPVTAIGLTSGLAALAVPFLPRVLADPPAPQPVTAVSAPQTGRPAPTSGAAAVTTTTEASPPSGTTTSTTTPAAPPRATTASPVEKPPETEPPETSLPGTRPTRRPTFSPVTIDATAPGNTITGAQALECATCASGSRVGYLAGAASVRVPVPGVEVAGTRTLTIVYESDGPRDLFVSVNGGTPHQLTGLPGRGDWETPATTSLRIELAEGTNTLVFDNPQGPAPDLDRFSIR